MLSIQTGDLSMKMSDCAPTDGLAPQDFAILCTGSIEDARDFKIQVTFTNAMAVDDKGNEYNLSTSEFLLGAPGIIAFSVGGTSQLLMPGLPVKFVFKIVRMNREATATSLILDLTSSGSPSHSQAVFRGIPIRSH